MSERGKFSIKFYNYKMTIPSEVYVQIFEENLVNKKISVPYSDDSNIIYPRFVCKKIPLGRKPYILIEHNKRRHYIHLTAQTCKFIKPENDIFVFQDSNMIVMNY